MMTKDDAHAATKMDTMAATTMMKALMATLTLLAAATTSFKPPSTASGVGTFGPADTSRSDVVAGLVFGLAIDRALGLLQFYYLFLTENWEDPIPWPAQVRKLG